jgi:hypothetical protein
MDKIVDVNLKPEDVLAALRWHDDMKVVNDFGEHVWLKPYIKNGKRIGITDCCFVDNPCEHHAKLQQEEDRALKQ